jgi:hypothetical protein
MENKKNIKFLFIIILVIGLLGCASFDDYLETSSNENPAVIFDCNVLKANSNMLILMGINDANIPSKMMRSESIEFYLKNSNENLTIVDINSGTASDFMRFSIIHRKNAKKLLINYPQLSDMTVLGIFLKGLSVVQEKLSSLQTLENGSWRYISSLNTDLVKRKKILFVTKRLDSEDSVFYEKLVANTFQEENSE